MPRIRYAEVARSDLRHIHNYIAADNPAAAKKVITAIRDLVRKLGDHPEMGLARDEVVPGMRSIAHGNYVIFYVPDRTYVTVMRILHGAQDIDHRRFDA